MPQTRVKQSNSSLFPDEVITMLDKVHPATVVRSIVYNRSGVYIHQNFLKVGGWCPRDYHWPL